MKIVPALLLFAGLIACNKDEIVPPEETQAVRVNLPDDFSAMETAGTITVTLSFSRAATRSGTLSVELETEVSDAFTTAPAATEGVIEIPVARGAANATFNLTVKNNNLLDQERTVAFELIDVSAGFEIGSSKRSVFTIIDDETAVLANFQWPAGGLHENATEALDIKVMFSAPAPEVGTISIQLLTLADMARISTTPAMNANGTLEIAVGIGDTEVSFKVQPVDDGIIVGHQTIMFKIAEASGSIVPGNKLTFSMALVDDELSGKPKAYETLGGNWRYKETYEYDEIGRIATVLWEQETPFLRTGTKTYHYAANGLIEYVKESAYRFENFYQENGRIVRSEVIQDFFKVEYSEYDYDQAGNLGAQAQYHYQPDKGTYELSFIYVYLYDLNDNLYSQLTYIPGDNPDDPTLISTRTYEHYTTSVNPFPGLVIIPGIATQPHLPASYRIQENGADLSYQFIYEFREDGLPVKRTASGSTGTEMTYFHYY